MKIIGFVGPKSAGKDASAKILIDSKLAEGRIAFADPLKKICTEVFSIPPKMFTDPVFKEQPFTEPVILTAKILRKIRDYCNKWVPEYDKNGKGLYNSQRAIISSIENKTINNPRELLQIVGSEFIRDQIYHKWHMLAAFSPLNIKLKSEGTYCVTDIRFVNEYEYLVDVFGDKFSCYYIERPSAEEILATATHKSELQVKDIRSMLKDSQVIKNDGTLEDLKAKLLGKNVTIKPTKKGFKAVK